VAWLINAVTVFRESCADGRPDDDCGAVCVFGREGERKVGREKGRSEARVLGRIKDLGG